MITTGNIEVPGGRIGSGNAQVFDSSGLVRTMDNVLDRQERRRVLALQEEEARARAAAAAAKKAKEDEVVAEYQVLKGDVFREPLAEIQRQDIEFGRRLFADPRATAYQKQQFIADQKLKDLNRNEWLAAESKNFAEARTRLSPYYDIPATTERDFIQSRIKNDPHFYMKSHAPEFEQAIVSNPYRFKADVMGGELLKGVEDLTVDVKRPNGTRVEKKWTAIADKPMAPGEEPIINEKKAKALVLKNPVASEWLANFVEAESAKRISPTVSPVQAEHEATKEGLDRLFKNKVKVEWKEDLESTFHRKSAENKADKLSDVEVTPTGITRRVVFNDEATGNRAVRDGFNFGRAETYQLNKGAVDIGSNKTVYLMNPPENAPKGMFTPNGDGSYQTGFGFTTKTWNKLKDDAYVLTAPVSAKTKDGKRVVYPAGTPVDVDFGRRIAEKYPEKIQKTKAYILSPTRMQTVEAEDEDVAQFLKNPAMKDTEIIIPINQGNEFAPYEKKSATQSGSKW